MFDEEIERLKRDLQADREKNGIYLDKDNYEYGFFHMKLMPLLKL